MRTKVLRILPAVAAAVALAGCSRGGGEGEAVTTGGLPVPADAAPDDARLMRLIDQRVSLALARDRAHATVSVGPARLREALAQASRAARTPLPESPSAAAIPVLEPVARQIDALALRVDAAVAPGADVEALAQQAREVLDGLVAGAGTLAGNAGAVVETVRRHIANAIAIVEDIGRAQAALAQIAAGVVPDGYLALAAGDGSAPSPDEWPSGAPVAAFTVERNASGGRREGGGSPRFAVQHEELQVTAEILGLRPTSSNTATLDFALTNRGDDTLHLDWGGFRWTGAGDVALIHLPTGKRYPALRDEAGNRMATSSHVARSLAPGERRELWARYRVDAGVQRVSVSIPGFPLIDDVPVPQ